RRKLEEFYAGPGAAEPTHLSIPKGEYRFVVEPSQTAAPEAAASLPAGAPPGALGAQPPLPAASSRRTWLLAALAISLLVNAAVLLTAYMRPTEPRDELAQVRASSVWAPILSDDRTIFLVVGDYYIFGETDASMEVRRLVREFEINSAQDLENYLKVHPEDAD